MNLNKVLLVGRLTRDVECRTFPNGGKVGASASASTIPSAARPASGKMLFATST
jgi:single-stranded DNA-binding protein